MKKISCVVFVIIVISFQLSAQSISRTSTDDKLIDAVITRPWPGSNYPPPPALPYNIRARIYNELSKSEIREAYVKLDANRRNVEWFDGIAGLEKNKAVW